MALLDVICPFCRKGIRPSSSKCPHCNEPLDGRPEWNRVKSTMTLKWWHIVPAVIIGLAFTLTSSGGGKNKDTSADCRQDLQCWGERHNAAASRYCREPIERLAKYNFRWLDGDSLFQRFGWKKQETGSLTYVGDAIELQNGFGAWQRHTYECDFEPLGNSVLTARAHPGRLPPR